MTTSPWFNFQTAVSNSGVGVQDWVNITNVLVDDASYAYSSNGCNGPCSGSKVIYYCVQRNLLHTLAPSVNIQGVQYRVMGLGGGSYGSGRDDTVKLWQSAAVGNDKSIDTNFSGSFTERLYGGAADLWGLTSLRGGDINSNFGVAFSGYIAYGVGIAIPCSGVIQLQFAQVRFTYSSNLFFF